MRAFVSGQSGVALLNDGSHWSVLRDSDGQPSQGQFSSAIRLLDGSTDIVEIPDADAQDIGLELAAARAKDTALQYVLVLVQESEVGELERRILARLKHLLFFPEIPEFILNRLYATPLGSSDRARVKALIAQDRQHPVSAILRSVLRDQVSIRRVRSAWENISAGRFRSIEDKDEFFFSALERGLVRRLTQDPKGVLREMGEIADRSSEILRSWAEALSAYQANPKRRINDEQKIAVAMGILLGLQKWEREVLMRFYLKEQTVDQICSEMDLTETQFRLVKSRAKTRFDELVTGRTAHTAHRTGFPPACRDESSNGPMTRQPR